MKESPAMAHAAIRATPARRWSIPRSPSGMATSMIRLNTKMGTRASTDSRTMTTTKAMIAPR